MAANKTPVASSSSFSATSPNATARAFALLSFQWQSCRAEALSVAAHFRFIFFAYLQYLSRFLALCSAFRKTCQCDFRVMNAGDIPFDVLSRLPTKSLLDMRFVSKEWHQLISDRLFVQAQLQKTGLTLSGFIFQEKYQKCLDDIKTFSYMPVNAESKVQKMVFGFLPEDVVILASCNGLVCCRSCFPKRNPTTIYVCNPLFKKWVSFEVAQLDRFSNFALVFDPILDPVNTSTNFKIVRIQQLENEQEKMYYTFEIYSSETGTWKKANEICHSNGNLLKNKGIYAKGFLHWLTDTDQILAFDTEKELSLLISSPIPGLEFFINVPGTCIGESKGLLHFIMICEDGIIVWRLDDYFETKWTHKHSKQLQVIEEENPKMFFKLYKNIQQKQIAGMDPWMDPLAFKDEVLLMRVYSTIYFYHIETGKVVEVCNVSSLGPNPYVDPSAIPYSSSLVPLNISLSQPDSNSHLNPSEN
ncbi:F-box protein At5g49610-like [Benincasa hispida]|uniref:F-box protein At5g49610-like n=1 Tax=Benincasa hispida TaxID=102211 RepID=UPI0019002F5D|nr:F-box protein At5g49610-like [Benincasa hispida]